MLRNFTKTLKVTVPLFVNSEPEETVKPYTKINKETGEEEAAEFISNTLNGVIMTDELGEGVYQKLKIGINNNTTNRAVTPTQVMKSFYKNEADLASGKKHFLAEVTLNPRGNEDGAHAFYPQLDGLEIVESSSEDVAFIKSMSAVASTVI